MSAATPCCADRTPDEVVTFRNSHGGAQQHYGLAPDITALGKIT